MRYLRYIVSSAADVNSCVIVNEQDEDFGEIVTFSPCSEKQTEHKFPSQLLNCDTLVHLFLKQQKQTITAVRQIC